MKFFKYGYAVRGTRKDINSRLKAILEAGFAVGGDINSRWKAINDLVGYVECCSSGRIFCSLSQGGFSFDSVFFFHCSLRDKAAA